MRAAVVMSCVAALSGGCAIGGSFGREATTPARVLDASALVASTATLACDWGQTHKMATAGWQTFYNGRLGTMWTPHEDNPIMGHNPSVFSVNMYFAAAVVLNAAIWYAMPPKYRSIIPAGITAFQAKSIVGNVPTTDSVCGL